MQNQYSLRITLDSKPRPVHIMFFTNFSLTLTGMRGKTHARAAIAKLLALLPEFVHTTPIKCQNTTLHYSLPFIIDLYSTATVLRQQLDPNYIVVYLPDFVKYVRVLYKPDTPESSNFNIQKSGKIMQSTSNGDYRRQFHVIVDAIEAHRTECERVVPNPN